MQEYVQAVYNALIVQGVQTELSQEPLTLLVGVGRQALRVKWINLGQRPRLVFVFNGAEIEDFAMLIPAIQKASVPFTSHTSAETWADQLRVSVLGSFKDKPLTRKQRRKLNPRRREKTREHCSLY